MWKASTLLLAAVLVLATLGLVMLASTSGIKAQEDLGNPYYYLQRQVLWLILALVCGYICARVIDYHYFEKLSIPLAIGTAVLLVMVFLPGIGSTVKGSTRWLKLGPVNFQPSELAKLSAVVWVAWWMSRYQRQVCSFKKGFLIPIAFPMLLAALILVEPDFGTTMLIAAVVIVLVFLGGAQISYLSVVSVLGIVGIALAVMENDVRRRRIMAFLNPDAYAKDEAFQLIQAKYAFISGGELGVGLGESLQKRFYLPEAHTDFIFAIIGEELGMIATVGVVLLYFLIFACGLYIGYKAKDLFGKLLGLGITLLISLQACANIGVVTGCLPTKGIALPLISFGGSSLVMTFAMIGILINIASQAGEQEENGNKGFIKNKTHWV